MLESIFPVSFKTRGPARLAFLIAAYLALPVFIGVVGGLAGAIPYVSAVMMLLTAVVSLYCLGGIITALLFFFGKLH